MTTVHSGRPAASASADRSARPVGQSARSAVALHPGSETIATTASSAVTASDAEGDGVDTADGVAVCVAGGVPDGVAVAVAVRDVVGSAVVVRAADGVAADVDVRDALADVDVLPDVVGDTVSVGDVVRDALADVDALAEGDVVADVGAPVGGRV